MTISTIDFARWSGWKVPEAAFDKKREPYLQQATYDVLFNEFLGGISMVTTGLPQYQSKVNLGGFMSSTRQRVWDVMDWMSLQYSAGAPVEQLAEIWPHAMDWADEFARFHTQYHQTAEADNYVVPHAALRTEDYWTVALRLMCFGLLTGHARDMTRVMSFLDYANEDMGVRDGLLERLVAPFVADRGEAPDTATRHLPYRKLFKVFDAAPDKRPALMAAYLDEWYHASRREPYIDQHQGACMAFYGYWAWEAAATTWVLGIDDTTYRDMPFYPSDLADFAKSFPNTLDGTVDTPRVERIPAGESCPRTGWWSTPAKANSRKHFGHGDVFPTIEGSDYGATFWQWAADQTSPTL